MSLGGRGKYRRGEAETEFVEFYFFQGKLGEELLGFTEEIAQEGGGRSSIRKLHRLRGVWHLERGEWALAAANLQGAVRMAREVGKADADSEAGLALAKFHLGQLPDSRYQAEQLSRSRVTRVSHRTLAELWLVIGDSEQAKKHALAAYEWAWADGEPYVHRYELNKACSVMEQLGVEIPRLPPYDPTKDEKLPWEDKVEAAIAKLRLEKEAKKVSKTKGRMKPRLGR
jgi:hypothetical protein